MGHNLNFNEKTGKYSFFSVQQKAWHGLGQIVTEYPTSEEAIKHAGLDYEVVKSPLFTKGSGIVENSGSIEIGSIRRSRKSGCQDIKWCRLKTFSANAFGFTIYNKAPAIAGASLSKRIITFCFLQASC